MLRFKILFYLFDDDVNCGTWKTKQTQSHENDLLVRDEVDKFIELFIVKTFLFFVNQDKKEVFLINKLEFSLRGDFSVQLKGNFHKIWICQLSKLMLMANRNDSLLAAVYPTTTTVHFRLAFIINIIIGAFHFDKRICSVGSFSCLRAKAFLCCGKTERKIKRQPSSPLQSLNPRKSSFTLSRAVRKFRPFSCTRNSFHDEESRTNTHRATNTHSQAQQMWWNNVQLFSETSD